MTARGPRSAQGATGGRALGSTQRTHPLWRRVADYCEGLIIGQGRRAGQKMVLYPWQKRFLRGAFGQDDDAALSTGRGSGKTTFMAAICCAALNGPLAQPMGEVVLIASSFGQGSISYRHILHFLRPAFEADPRRYRVQNSPNRARIEDRETGAVIRVMGSDPDRLHGIAPSLLLLDEVSAWPMTRIDRMLAALTTARGKIPGSKALWVGTRPSSPDHPFERALQGGLGYSQVHAAGQSPPFQRRTWKRANPGLDLQPDLLIALKQEAGRAKRDPQQLASFKALRLNMGVADSVEALVLDSGVWESIETSTPLPVGPYVLGLDLGQNAAMSAAAAYWPTSAYLDSFAVFPENPSLPERGQSDGVGSLYERCEERGELILAGERVSDVRALLNEVLERWGTPVAIVCDSWRRAELIGHLEAVGFPVAAELVCRRQGFQDGAEDLRAFRTACLDGSVAPRVSLLLRAAMTSARTTSDSAGNVKLAKGTEGRRRGSRDDAVSAAILAVSEGRRRAAAPTSLDYAIV